MESEFVNFVQGKEIECIEYNLLLRGVPITKSLIRDFVDRSTNYEKDVKEEEIDSWLTTIEWRSIKYIETLYEVAGNAITPLKTWEEVPEYFLCIHFSLYGASNDQVGTKLFEKISGHALKNFINGEVYVLGFPDNKNLNEYLDDIAAICQEERGRKANSDYKDDGVDVIGYKDFGDGRSANLYILLQCAAGIHWKKKKPIPEARWTQYIYWVHNNIISSISTVDFVEKAEWGKQSSTYGMLFDRLRIYNCLYDREIERGLREEVINWCGIIIN